MRASEQNFEIIHTHDEVKRNLKIFSHTWWSQGKENTVSFFQMIDIYRSIWIDWYKSVQTEIPWQTSQVVFNVRRPIIILFFIPNCNLQPPTKPVIKQRRWRIFEIKGSIQSEPVLMSYTLSERSRWADSWSRMGASELTLFKSYKRKRPENSLGRET